MTTPELNKNHFNVELDAFVHHYVMESQESRCPPYSRSHARTFGVLTKMAKLGFDFYTDPIHGKTFRCSFKKDGMSATVSANSSGVAICSAAIRAIARSHPPLRERIKQWDIRRANEGDGEVKVEWVDGDPEDIQSRLGEARDIMSRYASGSQIWAVEFLFDHIGALNAKLNESAKSEGGAPEGEPAFDEEAAIGILSEFQGERANQHNKWGEQNWPSLNRNCETHGRNTRCRFYYIPPEKIAKRRCDERHRLGSLSWADILLEEFVEVVCADDDVERRAELVQTGAVVAAWIEAIDRRIKVGPAVDHETPNCKAENRNV